MSKKELKSLDFETLCVLANVEHKKAIRNGLSTDNLIDLIVNDEF